jgi:pimeloyl-ACP methyl ester carboxylesterase
MSKIRRQRARGLCSVQARRRLESEELSWIRRWCTPVTARWSVVTCTGVRVTDLGSAARRDVGHRSSVRAALGAGLGADRWRDRHDAGFQRHRGRPSSPDTPTKVGVTATSSPKCHRPSSPSIPRSVPDEGVRHLPSLRGAFSDACLACPDVEVTVDVHLAPMRRLDIDAAVASADSWHGLAEALQMMRGRDRRRRLTVPTLVVYGRRDHPWSEQVLQLI